MFKDASQFMNDISVILSIKRTDFDKLRNAGKEEARKLHERNDEREGFYVLRNCQTFTELKTIDAAVEELTFYPDGRER
jgi:hypothetical protein